MKITLRDVARVAGVSKTAVSMALNDKPGIGESTRKRIRSAARELGYIPVQLKNQSPDDLGTVRLIVFKRHGKVVSDTPFFSSLMEGIHREVRETGLALQVSYVSERDVLRDPRTLAAGSRHSGIVLLATEMTEGDVAQFREMVAAPLVILDAYFRSEKLDTVAIDNFQGAYDATSLLITNGHIDIGYLRSSVTIRNFTEREWGFREALKDHGIACREEMIFSLSSRLEEAHREMAALLAGPPRLPSAFAAANDDIAFGAVTALQQAGYRIPEDVSVVGFDDLPYCTMLHPALTSVRVPKQEYGMIAVRRLLDLVRRRDSVRTTIRLATEVIERGSVKALC